MTRAMWRERLSEAEVGAVTELVSAATDADGVAPLSEHVLLHLSHGGDAGAANLLLRGGRQLVGYAHLNATDGVAAASGEIVVHPDHRKRGYGRALVGELRTHAGNAQLRLWAHGHQPAAAALAQHTGFTRTRVLWQMRLSLAAPVPEPSWPTDIAVRTFLVGHDEQAWLACNSRAFAGHPEQGDWTLADLLRREAEPWFDPGGFFLAERGGQLAGFHWTKVHRARPLPEPGAQYPAIGEVYVVGVDPDAQGTGLGAALTVHGLRHLRSSGLAHVLLYVDENNPRAVALYERLGFIRWDSDVTYSSD